MSNTSKQDILDAIRQTAKENGGIPLGMNKFEKETSITRYDCNKFWATFGEAQREAGFTANVLQVPHGIEFLLESMVVVIKEKGRFPTRRDLLVKRNSCPKFPNPTSIVNRLGNKKEQAEKICEYAKRLGLNDIVDLCRPIIESSSGDQDTDNSDPVQRLGEVYLFKSGRYYKIGKTNDTVRRGAELRIQLPEKCVLIHSIKTDDPSGIEAYWHRRVESKRLNGEWFDLSSAEVKAFKRWQRIS
ncbi:MAG: GIY-YIG nuclease family protein [Candidatus Omnitrophica bacterium]|nr:GIY-YIG nuclease family protein [Candidatus Omnitrophota bacterium]